MSTVIQELRVDAIGPSLNKYGRAHYNKKRLVDRWNKMIGWLVKEQGINPVQSYPVRVEVECYFGNKERRFDWDNLSPTPKLIQDALVHAGILQNDSAHFVKSGTMSALKTKGDSYTVFRIIETG
jgi:Holliday junction resolvase RusA-like endonuclease